MKWYRKAALKGHALGQSNLGAMYDKGRGVDRDYAQAVKWYRKSALKGHALGQHNLGVMYFKGRGIAKDYTQAFKWYRKSALKGFGPAPAQPRLYGRTGHRRG